MSLSYFKTMHAPRGNEEKPSNASADARTPSTLSWFEGTQHVKTQQAGDAPVFKGVRIELMWNPEMCFNKQRLTREVKEGGAKRQNPSSHGHSGSLRTASSAPMTSGSSWLDGVTAVDSSFPATGRVGELWEVRSSLVVETVHPILVNCRST